MRHTTAIRVTSLLVSAGLGLTLGGCVPQPGDDAPDEPEFAKRQLDAVALTLEDYGPGWQLVEGEEGSGGGGPAVGDTDAPDLNPCEWATDWLPDYDFYEANTWQLFTTGDGFTYSADWIAAVDPEVDGSAVLAEFRDTLTACDPVQLEDEFGQYVVTIVPDIEPLGLGDESFAYRADFSTLEGEVYGAGELHTFLCGPLWVHLSYIGNDPFVEREPLLSLLEERVAPLGGC